MSKLRNTKKLSKLRIGFLGSLLPYLLLLLYFHQNPSVVSWRRENRGNTTQPPSGGQSGMAGVSDTNITIFITNVWIQLDQGDKKTNSILKQSLNLFSKLIVRTVDMESHHMDRFE